MNEALNVVILGSGPAGYTAAIYAARANLNPCLIMGDQPGGQLTITTEVENYPGFSKGILGQDLMDEFKKQAQKFETKIVSGAVQKVDLSCEPFSIEVDNKEILACAVIIATGASAKLLGIESETRLMGKGVSACATCDGFFFKDKEVIVVGGGDSAIEEALFLTKFCSKVYLVHRRDKLRASKIMQDKAFNNKKISFIWNSVIEDIIGEDQVKAVSLRDVKNQEIDQKKVDGIFMAVGHKPNTDLFQGQLKMDEAGYILTQAKNTCTSIAGVFACGDVQDKTYRQAITAAGSGCMAAIDAEKFLDSL